MGPFNAQPRGNQLVIGLGLQKWSSKVLLTLIVAKHLPVKYIVSLSSLHKGNNEISTPDACYKH